MRLTVGDERHLLGANLHGNGPLGHRADGAPRLLRLRPRLTRTAEDRDGYANRQHHKSTSLFHFDLLSSEALYGSRRHGAMRWSFADADQCPSPQTAYHQRLATIPEDLPRNEGMKW